MTKEDNRNEVIEAILEEIAMRSNPSFVSVQEKVKRKYWM